MATRRSFIKTSGIGALGLSLTNCANTTSSVNSKAPIVASTWRFGKMANAEAWNIIKSGGSSLDAVEAGVRVIESDPENTTVGLGGFPDNSGAITLDACIMNHLGQCGSVAYLQNIEHPISVARKVMEETPHVMLVGQGALQFAKEKGFTAIDLHTDKSREAYNNWKEESKYKTKVNVENHDTIGMLAIDNSGHISGACTTSGMAFKLAGRVGDSPIIGAGLYLDSDVGGAVATGVGEEIIRVSGAAIIVELMRQGASPEQACKELVSRVMKRNASIKDMQVCFLAMDMHGNTSSHSIYEGFQYAIKNENQDEVINGSYERTYSE